MSSTKKEKPDFRTVNSKEEARQLIESLERGETMMESVVQGDGMLAGKCDELRPSKYGEKYQVQPPLVGRPHHSDVETLASDIYDKQLQVRIVEWEDRVP